jgi:hypothetical protein
MSKGQKTAWVVVTTLVIVIVIGIGDVDNNGETFNSANAQNRIPGSADRQRPIADGGDREVQIVDQGLNMVVSTVRVPAKWSVQQDIAYDPNTGMPARFKLVTVGPRNQYARAYAGVFPYGNVNNIPFDQATRQAIDHVLEVEQLENLQFGPSSPSNVMMRDSRFQEMAQRLAGRGQRIEAYESEFTGQRNGRQYKGRITFTNIVKQNAGFGVLQPSSMLFALAEDYPSLRQIADEISENLVPNPQYSQAMAQISHQVQQRSDAYSRQLMNQSAVAHQKRMADRQAAFASHQKSMAGLNQLQDVAHESYMTTLRSNGSFSSVGGDYSSHDAFIDQTHERTSFTDPWAGSEISLDGQYDYNYTNGLGDYYRTNDPAFEPASLQGDWQAIDPLKP